MSDTRGDILFCNAGSTPMRYTDSVVLISEFSTVFSKTVKYFERIHRFCPIYYLVITYKEATHFSPPPWHTPESVSISSS
jgi:hypothetical protein